MTGSVVHENRNSICCTWTTAETGVHKHPYQFIHSSVAPFTWWKLVWSHSKVPLGWCTDRHCSHTSALKSYGLWTRSCDSAPHNEWNIKMPHTPAHLNTKSFWWWQCSVRYSSPHPLPPGISVPVSLHLSGTTQRSTSLTTTTGTTHPPWLSLRTASSFSSSDNSGNTSLFPSPCISKPSANPSSSSSDLMVAVGKMDTNSIYSQGTENQTLTLRSSSPWSDPVWRTGW